MIEKKNNQINWEHVTPVWTNYGILHTKQIEKKNLKEILIKGLQDLANIWMNFMAKAR